MFFPFVPISAALILAPVAAEAGGMSHMGTGGAMVPNLNCKQPVSAGKSISTKPATNTDINVYKPVTINKNLNVATNIDNAKTIDINKTINVNTGIDNSKSININKNVDDSKNIDIGKSMVITKGGSEAEALAIAMAQASANASAVVSFNGGSNNSGITSIAGSISGATAYCRP